MRLPIFDAPRAAQLDRPRHLMGALGFLGGLGLLVVTWVATTGSSHTDQPADGR